MFSIDNTDFTGRNFLIEYGFNGFISKPLFGYGFMNFSEYVYKLYGIEIGYAHNNYIELLFDLGIIGTTIYYLPYFMIIKKGFYNYKNHNKDYFLIYLISCVFTLLILDFFTMGMKFVLQYLIIGISIYYFYYMKRDSNTYANKFSVKN